MGLGKSNAGCRYKGELGHSHSKDQIGEHDFLENYYFDTIRWRASYDYCRCRKRKARNRGRLIRGSMAVLRPIKHGVEYGSIRRW